ncbi:Uncharacterised protein [Nocardia otitidiscaviarum]|uniref:DUF3592 domain-containing protein n=1 Tax=Nocardia otitidiscaviarum TaxID=1823 RepID=A0A379JHT0_9NOCA|nr:hypothetical protein [Nocardia otitidiscaviarum]SUD47916.1 Uncharacterised protein [Nocardia otitidiscaviarum]
MEYAGAKVLSTDEYAVWRIRNWSTDLIILTVIVLVGLTGIGLFSMPNAAVYLTGERVAGKVRVCQLNNRERPGWGYTCTGSWRLADGRTGVGKLEGVGTKHPRGAVIALRVRDDAAVIESPRWLIFVGIGATALVALVTIAIRATRRWLQERQRSKHR